MPTTQRSANRAFHKDFATSATSTMLNVGRQYFRTPLSTSSSLNPEIVVFHDLGPCAIQRIVFIPTLAVTEAGGAKWVIAVTNKGTDGLGSTSVVSYDTSTSGNAFTAFDAKALYAPATELVVAADTVFSLNATKTGTPADLDGVVVVEYIQLVNY